MRFAKTVVTVLLMLVCGLATAQEKKSREQKVREDKERVEAEGFWIYNDIGKGFETARSTGKPMLVVLRCLPCEECVKLDDELMDNDPVVRPLLDKFVCVRQVSTNGLDLSLFQYDTDQSFAVFFLNADGTIYGRFGTRSHRTEWLGDVSLEGMAAAMQGALELHREFPGNRALLASKRGKPLEFATPEKYPALKERYTDKLNYEGNVVASCIHCHQIGDARRDFYRSQGKAIPDDLLFPFPHPKSLGLILDPDQRAVVKGVTDNSVASRAGFKQGDVINTLNGQPLLSLADVQWVLQGIAPSGGNVAALIQRGGDQRTIQFTLPDGWRQADDIAWRSSAWGLRRMTAGGLKLTEATAEQRAEWKIAEGKMALLVTHAGKYGPHAAAHNAGVREGDVVVDFDGRSDLLTDSQLLAYGVTKHRPGDKVSLTVLREGQRRSFTIPMQQ